MLKMHGFLPRSYFLACLWGVLFCLILGIITCPVTAADENIVADLGDTLTLHGISYTSSQVYLFMTGPGLDSNGVTLTNVFERADKGNFTIVNVDSSQKWSYRWDTSRIEPDINPGTYIVYVTTEPVDKAHLGGASTYKTLEAFLKDSGNSKISISTGPSYTLNPEMHSSVYAPPLNLTAPTPTPAPTTIPSTPISTPATTPLPTTKASLQLSATLLACTLCAICIILMKRK
jgi:hypothetical protein